MNRPRKQLYAELDALNDQRVAPLTMKEYLALKREWAKAPEQLKAEEDARSREAQERKAAMHKLRGDDPAEFARLVAEKDEIAQMVNAGW